MAELNDSILDTTKKVLGLESDYTAFDTDIIMHINSVFFTLTQMGVGPVDGFSIIDNSKKWSDFMGTDKIEAVRTFMVLKVRLLFDPPSSSFALESFNKQAEEMGWRLNVHMEGVRNPLPVIEQPTLF